MKMVCSTPDYITPECQNLFNNLDGNKVMTQGLQVFADIFFVVILFYFFLCDALFLSQENIPCPASPEKLKPTKSKRLKQGKYIVLRSFHMYDSSLKMFLQFSIVFVEQVSIV